VPDADALAVTPGQTVGPFFHYALPFPGDRELVPAATPGSLLLYGYVFDGEGDPVPDALLEIRQAGPDGIVPREPGSLRRAGNPFTGWGRSTTDRSGRFWFSTLEPGGSSGTPAPFFAVSVFARGLLHGLFTRAYLPGDVSALTADPLLNKVRPERRSALLCRRERDGLRFDIHLQGPRESVFLQFPRPS
jgi:protocatechuate 3,4-dioxygenase alpha subunit